MMSNEKMGGPAFPVPIHPSNPGMKLWDYYAAAALAGVSVNVEHAELAADWAARCADAMIAERAKRMEAES